MIEDSRDYENVTIKYLLIYINNIKAFSLAASGICLEVVGGDKT